MQMNSKLKTPFLCFFEGLFIFLFFILQYNVSDILKIGNASPPLLAILVFICGFFFGEAHGLYVGLISGILMDAVTVDSTCFYALLLMILGFFAGSIATHLLNNNFGAALTLGGTFTAIFFLAKWLFFYVFKGNGQGSVYLSSYALPSYIYSLILFVGMYFVFKFIKKKLTLK